MEEYNSDSNAGRHVAARNNGLVFLHALARLAFLPLVPGDQAAPGRPSCLPVNRHSCLRVGVPRVIQWTHSELNRQHESPAILARR